MQIHVFFITKTFIPKYVWDIIIKLNDFECNSGINWTSSQNCTSAAILDDFYSKYAYKRYAYKK